MCLYKHVSSNSGSSIHIFVHIYLEYFFFFFFPGNRTVGIFYLPTSVLFSAVHTKVLSCMSSDPQPLRTALEFLGYLSSASVKLRQWTSHSDASVIFIPISIPWSQWKNSWGTKTRTSPCHLSVVTGHNFIPPVRCLPGPTSLYSNQIIFISLSHILMVLCAQLTSFCACIQHYHYDTVLLSCSF